MKKAAPKKAAPKKAAPQKAAPKQETPKKSVPIPILEPLDLAPEYEEEADREEEEEEESPEVAEEEEEEAESPDQEAEAEEDSSEGSSSSSDSESSSSSESDSDEEEKEVKGQKSEPPKKGPKDLDAIAHDIDKDITAKLDAVQPMPDVPLNICDVTDIRVFSLFDGHGGAACARRAAQLMNRFLISKLLDASRSASGQLTTTLLGEVLDTVFADFHQDHCYNLKSGSTASLIVLCSKIVAIATIGDSRTVLFRMTGADSFDLLYESPDHNTDSEDEKARLKDEGVKLQLMEKDDVLRFESGLSVTRTLGDTESKHVTRVPAVFCHVRQPGDKLVAVMASDGMWDSLKNADVTDVLKRRTGSVVDFASCAAELCNRAYEAGSEDNITAQVISVGVFGPGAGAKLAKETAISENKTTEPPPNKPKTPSPKKATPKTPEQMNTK